MTYQAKEISEFGASPYELYHFTAGSQIYRYTNGDVTIDDGTNLWLIDQIDRESIGQSQEPGKKDLKLTTSQEFPISRLFIGPIPRTPIALIIYRQHRGDSEIRAIWNGTVRSASYRDEEVDLYCETVMSSTTRQGLNRVFGRSCNHFLYDNGCTNNGQMNPESFATNVTVTSISSDGLTITASGTPSAVNYLTAGFVTWNLNGDKRFIVNHAGGTSFTLLTPFPGLTVGQILRVYKGCRRDVPSCLSFLNGSNASGTNIENMDAFPYVPLDNVFTIGLK